MTLSRNSSRRSSHSTASGFLSNPDSAIDIPDNLPFFKDMTEEKLADVKSKRIVKIKLPNVFSSITAAAARLNPLLNSTVPMEADEWTRRYVQISCHFHWVC
jgi:hypothetical protein